MNRLEALERSLRIIRIIVTLGVAYVFLLQMIMLPKTVAKAVEDSMAKHVAPVIDTLGKTIADVDSTVKSANAMVTEVSKDYYDPSSPEVGFYWDVKAALESSTVSARQSEAAIEDLRAGIMGGKDAAGAIHEGIFPAANSLLGSAKGIMDDSRRDLALIFDDDKGLLKPLKSSIDNIERLTLDLDREIQSGGNLDKTFGELAVAVGDFNKLLNNEDITKILSSSADTSHSLAESAKSVEIALAPWRKKASQLKMILTKLLGMIKFVVAF